MLKQKEAKFGPVKDHVVGSSSSVPDGLSTYSMPTLEANTATLKVILSSIVEWILKSGKKVFRLRESEGSGTRMEEGKHNLMSVMQQSQCTDMNV
jgi:hypothetical protein